MKEEKTISFQLTDLGKDISGEKFYLFGERIENFKIKISEGINGNSSFTLKKGSGTIKASGKRLNSYLDYKFYSKNLKLQDFNFVPKIATGDILIEGKLFGTEKEPRLIASIKIINTSIRGKTVFDSNLSIKYENELLSVNGNLLGEDAALLGKYDKTCLMLTINLQNFDFNPILSIVSSNYSEAIAHITGTLTLNNEVLSGNIKDINIIKDQNTLKLENEISFTIDKKKITTTPITLKGEGVEWSLFQRDLKSNNDLSSFDLSAKLDLNLLYPAIPTVTHAKGILKYNGHISYNNKTGELKTLDGVGSLPYHKSLRKLMAVLPMILTPLIFKKQEVLLAVEFLVAPARLIMEKTFLQI